MCEVVVNPHAGCVPAQFHAALDAAKFTERRARDLGRHAGVPRRRNRSERVVDVVTADLCPAHATDHGVVEQHFELRPIDRRTETRAPPCLWRAIATEGLARRPTTHLQRRREVRVGRVVHDEPG